MNTKSDATNKNTIAKRLNILLEPWLEKISNNKPINEQTNLLTDLGLDSVAILHLVLGIEKEFDITINNQELDSTLFSKMINLIDMIEKKLNETN